MRNADYVSEEHQIESSFKDRRNENVRNTDEVSESVNRRSSVKSEPYMMGGRRSNEGGNGTRSKPKLTYA